jgi:hypothetical protein
MSTIVAKSKKHDGIIIPSQNNAEFGAIMVIETRNNFDGGFVNIRKRVGLLKGKMTDLVGLNWKENQTVPLKVVYKESLEPFYTGQDPKRYPEFNSDGTKHEKSLQPITSLGAPIYVNKLVVSETSDELDVLLPMDKEPIQVKTTPATSKAAKANAIGI